VPFRLWTSVWQRRSPHT